MFCVKCGKELPEGANVCPNCGEKIEKEVSFEDVKAYAGQKAQQASASIRGKYQEFKDERKKTSVDREINDVSDIFVSADEGQKAVIGGGYLKNLLSGNGLSKGFGVLTNRRLYYRGKSYYKVGGRFMKTKEDCTVDLRNITSSGFTYTRRLWLLVLAIFSFVFAFCYRILMIIRMGDYRYMSRVQIKDAVLIYILLLAVALVSLTAYILFEKTIYSVTFAGGCLGINVSFFGIEKLRDFDKALHQAKDERLAEDRQLDRGNS